jgi:TRAP-type mannitol/chloroaromatic compound transport system permease large subunit
MPARSAPASSRVVLFVLWVAIVSVCGPREVPALSVEQRTLKGWALRATSLRGIAPPSVKSSDIYWGAVPWVFR